MKNLSTKRSILCVTMLLTSSIVTAHGQKDGRNNAATPTCSLLVNVVDAEKPDSKIPAAAVFAKRVGSKVSIRPTPVKGLYLFSPLREGTVSIAASKAGFVTNVQEVEIDCTDFASVLEISLERKELPAKTVGVKRSGKSNREGNVAVLPLPSVIDVSKISVEPEIRYGGGGGGLGGIMEGGASEEEEKTATPPPRPRPVPKIINGGVVNGKATKLVKPPYPAAARAVRAVGAVNVQVVIDETGVVTSATAVTGHPLLRAAAVQAARSSKFSPTLLSGQPVKVWGTIVYNFVP